MIEGQTIEGRPAGGIGWIFNHLPDILWQRRLLVIVTFVVLTLAAVIAAYALPTMYRSTATLLVQSQELPSDVVQAPGKGQMEQRIARIRERVLSRGDLISLIEQYDLYPSERRSNPMSYVVDKMRKATLVGALAGDIGAGGGSTDNLIAVTVAFDYPEPSRAQSVLQSYVTRFLSLDNENIEDQANLTVRFLQDQAVKLQDQIRQIEGQLTELKARNGAALAGSGPSFMDTGSYSAQIITLENQNRQLLATSRSTSQGDPLLAQAEADLAAVLSVYSDAHPDVARARDRVETLRRSAANRPASQSDPVREQIRANNDAIASLVAARNVALSRSNAAMAGQARAPAIIEQAMQLENRASALRGQYNEVSNNLLKAQNSARMATEQRAERLSLVEPPNLPDRPHWPDRTLLIAAGSIGGLLLGLFLALVVEMVSRPMRSPHQVEAMGLRILGVVPVLQSKPAKKGFGRFWKRERKLA
jgi:succinoglycan biosynthesis transport protein ExoP